MPPASPQYTLVGFSAELDWRPVRFLKPIPENRICRACGVVRRTNALLPCMHLLCESCYQRCEQDGSRVCPLDGRRCQEEDVDWKESPAEEMLKREVLCWNREHGCKSVMPASLISLHFQCDCDHHAIPCPKCSAMVLCSDVCSHLKSDCSTKFQSPECERGTQPRSSDEQSVFRSFMATFEKQAAEINETLQRVVVDTATHDDRLNEISQGVNNLAEIVKQQVIAEVQKTYCTLHKGLGDIISSNEDTKNCLVAHNSGVNNVPEIIEGFERTLKNELSRATTRLERHVSQAAAGLTEELTKNAGTAREQIAQIIRQTQQHVAEWNFFVPGVKSLEEKALNAGSTNYQLKPVYMRGYCVLPGIRLSKDDTDVKLQATIILCKGDMDDYVQWPFHQFVGLCVVHPKDGTMKVLRVGGAPTAVQFQKPTESRNPIASFSGRWFYLKDLFSSGYVHNDTLLFKWELRPQVEAQ